MYETTDLTHLLLQAEDGDEAAFERLLERVYDELRAMAHRQLRGEYGSFTLCTTDLVHEAYLRLVNRPAMPLQSRAYFFGAAARAMRQILVDYARRRKAAKRGGGAHRLDLDAHEVAVDACADELVALEDALAQLAAFDDRLARVVECRFYGGLSIEETAHVLGISERTVKRDWRRARAWLYRLLYEDAPGDAPEEERGG